MKLLQIENSELIALEAALLYCMHNDHDLTVETVGHLAVLRQRLIDRGEAKQDFKTMMDTDGSLDDKKFYDSPQKKPKDKPNKQ